MLKCFNHFWKIRQLLLNYDKEDFLDLYGAGFAFFNWIVVKEQIDLLETKRLLATARFLAFDM